MCHDYFLQQGADSAPLPNMKIISYLALIFASGVLIIVFDSDPRSVQPYEWVCMGVMVYAAVRLVRLLYKAHIDQEW